MVEKKELLEWVKTFANIDSNGMDFSLKVDRENLSWKSLFSGGRVENFKNKNYSMTEIEYLYSNDFYLEIIFKKTQHGLTLKCVDKIMQEMQKTK